MEGEWEKAGLYTDDDIMELVREIRAEIEDMAPAEFLRLD
jgi:hypothetical protein